MNDPAIQARLDQLLWYHTIDVAPGATTRGWWDLRHAVGLLPWPEVHGKRCLDVGTWDGFYAYELERRGAGEVVAVDVATLEDLDYPPEVRTNPGVDLAQLDRQPRSAGFWLLHELMSSRVILQACNIYDLDPTEVGVFDVVIVGSLLVHLRDPVRALDAIRRVTAPGGHLLLVEFVHVFTQLLPARRPLFELRGQGSDFQWWLPNDSGLRQLLHVGGFRVQTCSPFFLLRPGSHYAASHPLWRPHGLGRRVANWSLTGDRTDGGHLHRAYLATPRL